MTSITTGFASGITTGFASGITPGIAQAPDDGAPIEGFPQGADLDLYAPPRRRTPMERVRDWLDARIAGESGRHILWAPVGIGIGIVGYFALAREPHPGAGLLALVLSSLMLAARFCWLRRVGLILLLLAIGFGAGQIRTNVVASPLLTVETRPTLVRWTGWRRASGCCWAMWWWNGWRRTAPPPGSACA